MGVAERLTKMFEKCNTRNTVKDENDETSNFCLHYKIESIKQIKKILSSCKRKKNQAICEWTNYYFPKSFLLVIIIADNELSITLDEYFKIFYEIDPNDLSIKDDDKLSENDGLYITNMVILEKVLSAEPAFYDMYIKYTTYMTKLNDIISDHPKLTVMKLNELEMLVNEYVEHAEKICKHLISKPYFKCENCICQNIKEL